MSTRGEGTKSSAFLLTPPGSAAIAVLRVTGPAIQPFLQQHFSGQPKPDRCVHGTLRDGATIIDDPVVVLSSDASTADINLHGGPWVVRSALDLARRAGFLIDPPSAAGALTGGSAGSVEPPPVRAPAALPDATIDASSPIEREILSHLPLATTQLALTELLRQEEAWARLESLPRAEQRTEAEAMLNDAGLRWLLHPPHVALVGAPNVGKSTLANQLFGQERSITADLPGTTRDWVGEVANLDGLPVMLLDTPGVRTTADPIESQAIARAATEVRGADLVVLILDASRPLEPEQADLIHRFPQAILVVNKCDLSPAWDGRSIEACHTIATSRGGIDLLQQKIKSAFGIDNRPNAARLWTDRQRQLLLQLYLSS